MTPLFLALYRRLVRLLPGTFRDRYGEAAVQLAAERMRDTHGLAAIRLGLRELLDLCRTIHVERRGVGHGLRETSSMIDRLRVDVSTAARSLVATPVTTAVAVLTIAVAVGVNLAMFDLVGRAMLWPPRHVVAPDRVFTVSMRPPGDRASQGRMTTMSYVAFETLRDRTAAIADAAAYAPRSMTLMLEGEQRRVSAVLVSGNYFELLGVRALAGAALRRDSDRHGSTGPVAVLSHAFWRSACGGSPDALGATLTIGGLDYVVSGVMPPGFTGHSSAAVDVWLPVADAMRDSPGWDRNAHLNVVSVVTRLAPVATAPVAEEQATAVTGRGVTLSAIGGADIAAPERRVAWWLAGVSGLVLVIGLANAATLLALRAARRRHAVAIRAALGASQQRLAAEALIEAVLLAVAATATVLLLQSWFDEAIRRVLFPGVIESQGLTPSAVAAAALAGVLTVIVATASSVRRTPIAIQTAALGAGDRAFRARPRLAAALMVVQTCLSVLLLAGAGMFGSSVYRLSAQDFGMQMNGAVIVQMEQGPNRASVDVDALFRAAVEPVRALPGVVAATIVDSVPFAGHHVPPIAVPGLAEPPSVDGQLPFLNAATPEFLRILGVQIVEGRAFMPADERGNLVVIVNATMARTVWPGESAIGKCIRIGFDPDFDPATAVEPPRPSERLPCRAVVGVARDVRQRSLLPNGSEARLMQYFVPFSQVPAPPFPGAKGSQAGGLLLRARVPADALAGPIRRMIVGHRTDLPFVQVLPYPALLDRQMRPWRIGTTLLALFSGVALVVAAIGLYATFAHAVAERRREMAIRLALGADPGGVRRLVLHEAVTLAAGGAALGCAAAVAGGRWVQALLFETSPSDPLVLASAAAAMLLVAGAATWLPARLASRADPNTLLRIE